MMLNTKILSLEIQEFIQANLSTNITSILLKGHPFKGIDIKDIIEQIEAKTRAEKKLPTWFNAKNIYYPNKLNIAQSSSELTANYKASLINGESLIDITGGFGVDAYYFAKQVPTVTHCEINNKLSEIVSHNTKVFSINNIRCVNDDGITVLKALNQSFDWVYVDPSRRDNNKQKVFLLSDCTPNIKTFQGLFFKYAKNVMLKTSPLLDITATLKNLKHAKALHIIAINNDVKELLWVLERGYEGNVNIVTKNFTKTKTETFAFNHHDETKVTATYNLPLTYLYEPNAAILKSGAFNLVSHKMKLYKLHKHAHLYTSEEKVEFPGRRLKIETILPFNKKAFSKIGITKANVTTRHFPLSVGEIKKKFKLKDGGAQYLFFTTNTYNKKVILICSKL